jgi:anaerobic ribonucleoside-triphosphate reductase activating protein
VADLKKEKNYLSGVTFSGGDPIEQADKFKILAKECKKMDLNV